MPPDLSVERENSKSPVVRTFRFFLKIPLQAIWNDVIVRLCSGAAASQCFVRCQWQSIATSIAPGKFKRGDVPEAGKLPDPKRGTLSNTGPQSHRGLGGTVLLGFRKWFGTSNQATPAFYPEITVADIRLRNLTVG
jgi:hypothetical protein